MNVDRCFWFKLCWVPSQELALLVRSCRRCEPVAARQAGANGNENIVKGTKEKRNVLINCIHESLQVAFPSISSSSILQS